tara:strand:- start:3897 stop:4406 length:510 start_codon:yes stop_codon:yes gene_type:complete
MENNLENKIELKDKINSFYKEYKVKIILFICTLFIFSIVAVALKINYEKKNKLISEKFITAGLYVASNENEKSKKIFEEIILSKNKFYSILALNSILEKNLVSDKKKMLSYFEIVENVIENEEQLELLMFKKALYLIKNSEIDEGNKLINTLIKKDTKYKSLFKELLVK